MADPLLRLEGIRKAYGDHVVTQVFHGVDLTVEAGEFVALSSPPLVLADEPTGNLDSESGEQVFRLLRRFNRTPGVAFLIVTHDDRIAQRCDRVVHLVDGRIVSDGPRPGQPEPEP